MKKIFVLLLLVLLATLPLEKWEQIPDKTEFLKLLGAVYLENFECPSGKALIGALEKDGIVYFFGDCLAKEVQL